MSTQIHYKNSPLIEAIIDIRVELPSFVTLEMLHAIREGDEELYPSVQKYFEGHVDVISTGDELVTYSGGDQTGYFFVSRDDRHVVQTRLNGFTFSRRGQYDTWHSFQKEAQAWWVRYRHTTQPQHITRLAVRYINRLELPLPLHDFRDYLRVVPDIATDLPQALNGFFMQLHIPQPGSSTKLVLNQALAGISDIQTLGIILDIELFQDDDVPQEETDIWHSFEGFRHRKNDIFEKCLTERMKELLR